MRTDASREGEHGGPEHPNSWVFINGEFRRYNDARIGLMTHALHYGTGVFEGIRAYWNAPQEQLFLLHAPEHYDRLRRSGNVMRMTLPHSTEELVNLTIELLRRNEFKADTYMRPLLFTSSEEIGVRASRHQPELPHLHRFPWQLRRDRGRPSLHGQQLAARARPVASARAKITGSYAQSALAKSEANENGFRRGHRADRRRPRLGGHRRRTSSCSRTALL